jgi:hypothetical protein
VLVPRLLDVVANFDTLLFCKAHLREHRHHKPVEVRTFVQVPTALGSEDEL